MTEDTYDRPAQIVTIFDDHVRAMITGGIEKIMSLDAFRDVLNTAIGTLDVAKLEGFNLPSNTMYFAKSGSQAQLSCYYSSRVSTIKYYDETFDIVMPNVIISHSLSKSGRDWQVTDTKYFCTDASPGRLPQSFINGIDHANRIFLFPMSNTYAEGHMCYGQNTMVRRFPDNNFRGLDWYYQYLFASPFNSDLGIAALARSMEVRSWYTLLRDLATEGKPFPYDKLRGFTPL